MEKRRRNESKASRHDPNMSTRENEYFDKNPQCQKKLTGNRKTGFRQHGCATFPQRFSTPRFPPKISPPKDFPPKTLECTKTQIESISLTFESGWYHTNVRGKEKKRKEKKKRRKEEGQKARKEQNTPRKNTPRKKRKGRRKEEGKKGKEKRCNTPRKQPQTFLF